MGDCSSIQHMKFSSSSLVKLHDQFEDPPKVCDEDQAGEVVHQAVTKGGRYIAFIQI